MGIKYYKLFDLLNRKGMKKSDLREILSSSTVAKLSKGAYISGEAIEKICEFLDCQPGDIMEYEKDDLDESVQKWILDTYEDYLDRLNKEELFDIARKHTSTKKGKQVLNVEKFIAKHPLS